MSLSDVKTPSEHKKQISLHSDDKDAFKQAEVEFAHDSDFAVLSTEREIVTHIVSVHDDPTLNPWTIRAFVIGLGLSAFGGVLGKSKSKFAFIPLVEMFEQRRYTISNQYGLVFFFYWLPVHLSKCQQQTVAVSTLFMAIISYILGITLETVIPQTGFLRVLNPVSFPTSY